MKKCCIICLSDVFSTELPPEPDLYAGEHRHEEFDDNINQIDLVGDLSSTVRVEDKILFTVSILYMHCNIPLRSLGMFCT